jgi:hypothetical protein
MYILEERVAQKSARVLGISEARAACDWANNKQLHAFSRSDALLPTKPRAPCGVGPTPIYTSPEPLHIVDCAR